MKRNGRLVLITLLAIIASVLINIALIWKFNDIDPSLWIGAQSLIVTICSGAWSIKRRINILLGREVDLLGVFGVALGIAAVLSPTIINRKISTPDFWIYLAITIIGIAFLIFDSFKDKNTTLRRFTNSSISKFNETNTEIIITTRIKK